MLWNLTNFVNEVSTTSKFTSRLAGLSFSYAISLISYKRWTLQYLKVIQQVYFCKATAAKSKSQCEFQTFKTFLKMYQFFLDGKVVEEGWKDDVET